LAYFSWEQIFFTTEYLAHFLPERKEFGRVRGLANGNLFPEFGELWSGGPVIPCRDMHQSFIDALVKYFFDKFPCLPIVLVLFLFTALPED